MEAELCSADGRLTASPSCQQRRIIMLHRITNRRCRIQPRSTDTRCTAGRRQLTCPGAMRTPEPVPDHLCLSLFLSGLWKALSTTTPSLRNRKFFSETYLWTSRLQGPLSDSPTNQDTRRQVNGPITGWLPGINHHLCVQVTESNTPVDGQRSWSQ